MDVSISIVRFQERCLIDVILKEDGKESIFKSIALDSDNQKEALSIAFAATLAKVYESQIHPTKEPKT